MTSSLTVRTIVTGFLALLLVGLPVQGRAATDVNKPAAAETSPGSRATLATSSGPAAATSTGYAQRESQSPNSADFEGGEGSGIYIGGSALTVLLVIVLLVILL